MLLRNREVKIELILYLILTGILTLIGIFINCGWSVFASCIILGAFYVISLWFRYRRMQKLSIALENLLSDGTPLPIRDYMEGDLSILSTQIQKMTLRLTEAADALRADKVFLADSLADISHQLRTPLTAMNIAVSMISQSDLSEKRRAEMIIEMKMLLSRTQWLVETLLKLSKLDAGTVKMEPEHMNAEQLIRKSMEPFLIPMELREQQIVLRCTGVLDVDPVWTAEALGNILKNCIEHTPAGGEIHITSEETALYTTVTIEDSGPGFSKEDIPHLFERFYKGKDAHHSSCGIGLSLARTIIFKQNGTIRAENTGMGARFVIKFYKQVI